MTPKGHHLCLVALVAHKCVHLPHRCALEGMFGFWNIVLTWAVLKLCANMWIMRRTFIVGTLQSRLMKSQATAGCQRNRVKGNSITNQTCWSIHCLTGFVRVWFFLVCTVSQDEQNHVVWAKAKQLHLEADVTKSECMFSCACCLVASCVSLWVSFTITVHRPKPSEQWPRGLTKTFMLWSPDNVCFLCMCICRFVWVF